MFTPEETIRAVRASLVGEQDAISQYTAQAEETDNPLVRRVLTDIAREERVHQGELITLLSALGDDLLLRDGEVEVKAVMRELDLCVDEGCTRLKLGPHMRTVSIQDEMGFMRNREKTP